MSKKYMKNQAKGAGFTLIELLVVISIIGLLATLAVVALNNAREKSRDAKRVSDIKQIQTALALFQVDKLNNSYPPSNNAPSNALTLGAGTDCTGACTLINEGGIVQAGGGSGKTYMGLIPADPNEPATNYRYIAYGEVPTLTNRCTSEPCPWYTIDFTLESAAGGLSAGVNVADPNGIIDSTNYCAAYCTGPNPCSFC